MTPTAMAAAALASLATLFPAGTLTGFAPFIDDAALRPSASVYFVGDMMFDRSIRNASERYGGDYIFECIALELASADLVVGNLEGPITNKPSVSLGSIVGSPENYTFTFPESTAPLLVRHGIRIVNLGNNHIRNFGNAGVRSTMRALDSVGVQYFGDPLVQRVATTSVNGILLAFVNYNQFEPSSTASATVAQIIEARERGELPVVYTHWGDEYKPATKYEKTLAHRFVDAGAAVVIGTHPHVVQEKEVYRDVPIYYSLGNFIFDQYWEESVRRGLMLDITFGQGGVEGVREIPTELQRDRRTCAVTAP